MVRVQVLVLVVIYAGCGMESELDGLEITPGKAEQAQLAATPIIMDAVYQSVMEPYSPGLFSLTLHHTDKIAVVLENLDNQFQPWAELYQDQISPENVVNVLNDHEDISEQRYEIQHRWTEPFRQKYYLKVKSTVSDLRFRYRLTVACIEGPCEEDPNGVLLTDRLEPNDTRSMAKIILDDKSDLLNLASRIDVDWIKIPIYKYDSPYISAEVVNPAGEPLKDVQVSGWYECTRGFNKSTCNMFPLDDSHLSYVYPELGPVLGCKGDYAVSLKRECFGDWGRSGQLFLRISWKPESTREFAFYHVKVY